MHPCIHSSIHGYYVDDSILASDWLGGFHHIVRIHSVLGLFWVLAYVCFFGLHQGSSPRLKRKEDPAVPHVNTERQYSATVEAFTEERFS